MTWEIYRVTSLLSCTVVHLFLLAVRALPRCPVPASAGAWFPTSGWRSRRNLTDGTVGGWMASDAHFVATTEKDAHIRSRHGREF